MSTKAALIANGSVFASVADGDLDTAAEQVNRLLDDTRAQPRLNRHDEQLWHLHYHGTTGGLAAARTTSLWPSSLSARQRHVAITVQPDAAPSSGPPSGRYRQTSMRARAAEPRPPTAYRLASNIDHLVRLMESIGGMLGLQTGVPVATWRLTSHGETVLANWRKNATRADQESMAEVLERISHSSGLYVPFAGSGAVVPGGEAAEVRDLREAG
ncbi:MAG: hypothetical protein JWN52_6457 [Actinomycetia bacterium]|nr:hypothetical protein [Actinomycetes bacterium]